MVQESIPFSGTTTGDAGPYSASLWADFYFAVRTGNFAGSVAQNGSYLPNTNSDGLQPLNVTAGGSGLSIVVLNGYASVQGYLFRSTDDEQFMIDGNNDASGDDRIDRVILRLDTLNQQIRIAILKGTVAASPSPPGLTQTASVYEVSLAQVLVQNGAAVITSSDITDERVCALLRTTAGGGTGIQTVNRADVLIANNANEWTRQAMSDTEHQILISQVNSPSGNGVTSLPIAPAVAWSTGTTSINATRTLIEFSNLDPSQGLQLAPSGRVILIGGGTFLLRGHVSVFDEFDSDAAFTIEIFDETNDTTIFEMGSGGGSFPRPDADLTTPRVVYTTAQVQVGMYATCSTGDGIVNGTAAAWLEIQRLEN